MPRSYYKSLLCCLLKPLSSMIKYRGIVNPLIVVIVAVVVVRLVSRWTLTN